jgi:hypothetical protein
MGEQETRVLAKRKSKRKSGYEVELREDGFYYIKSVPSKNTSVKPGDRVLEINGVNYTEFKTTEKANKLFDTLVLDVQEREAS